MNAAYRISSIPVRRIYTKPTDVYPLSLRGLSSYNADALFGYAHILLVGSTSGNGDASGVSRSYLRP